ncbi:sensor histidine kinase [Paraliomyxa miuraensis]|uniref:sensor histidine kinase n=1 Tax=Paraliomyxa miuraensis TaxID=376150 RepID=UPI002251DA6C|nr:ATP-binding protein [Paraliomyxa miuraensis]MCX4240731.1 ATP-binding protein [Paraliomyxa miuraensis]
MNEPRLLSPIPWWGRLGVRVTVALVVLGVVSVGASLYLARLSVEYFDARLFEALEQSRELAEEVEPVHHELVDAHIAAFEARAQVFALSLPASPEPAAALQDRLEREPDVRALGLSGPDRAPVEVGRPLATADDDPPETYEVLVPVPQQGRGARLRVEFDIDPAIDRRYQALGERKREIGQQRSSQAELEGAVVQVVAGAGVLVLLLAIAAGALVARATTRKATALSRAMARVAEGDLQVRAQARGRDELASLARAFNLMLDELAQAQVRVAYLQRIGAWQGMARRIAHEIKNPLTPIQLAVQQLRDKDPGLDPRFSALLRTSVEIVEDEVEGLRRMVSSFSQFAKVPEVRPKPEPVSRVLREFERAYGHLHDDEGGRLDVEMPRDDVVIAADRQLLKQALVNLVENAVLSAREVAPGQVHVAVGVSVEAGSVVLHVDDNGPGIELQRRERVFEPYETSRKSGTGLGLAIVKKIVLDHGGEIWIDGSSLGGARFCLRLPRVRDEG